MNTYDNTKPVTVKAARALYPGCLLEAYFNDCAEPIKYIVVERPDAHAGVWDIKVIPEEAWLNTKRGRHLKVNTLNTDRWTLIGVANGY